MLPSGLARRSEITFVSSLANHTDMQLPLDQTVSPDMVVILLPVSHRKGTSHEWQIEYCDPAASSWCICFSLSVMLDCCRSKESIGSLETEPGNGESTEARCWPPKSVVHGGNKAFSNYGSYQHIHWPRPLPSFMQAKMASPMPLSFRRHSSEAARRVQLPLLPLWPP